MNKSFETTKSFTAIISLTALILVAIIGVTSLNPVSRLLLASENDVAGVSDIKVTEGRVTITEVTGDLQKLENSVHFQIKPGVTKLDAGTLTLKNDTENKLYTNVSIQLDPKIKEVLRVELVDSSNKILLTDFDKEFKSQKITFNSNEERTFTVRYILSESINFTSSLSIQINP